MQLYSKHFEFKEIDRTSHLLIRKHHFYREVHMVAEHSLLTSYSEIEISPHFANFDVVYYDFAGQARTEIR